MQTNLTPQPEVAPSPTDAKTLWMGQIQQNWDETYVASLFESAGPVAVKIMRYPGSATGYAFVDFQNHESAQNALNTLSNQRIPETTLTFKLNWGVGGGRRSFGAPNEFSLFVGDLPTDVTDGALYEVFAGQYPSCSSAKVVIDAYTGTSKGYGFVRFTDKSQCDSAIASMNGTLIGGRQVRVSHATPPTRRHGSFHVGMHGGAVSAMPMQYQYVSPYGSPADTRLNGYRGQPQAIPGMTSPWLNARPEMGGPPLLASTRTSEESMSPEMSGLSSSMSIPDGSSVSSFPTPTSSENTTVFVGNLDPAVTEAQLHQHFQGFGNILQVKIPANRGCGFVKFDSHDSAEKALNTLNGTPLCSQRIRLDWGKASVARSQQAAMMSVDPSMAGYPAAYGQYYAVNPWQAQAYYYRYNTPGYVVPQQQMMQQQRYGQEPFVANGILPMITPSMGDASANGIEDATNMSDYGASAVMQNQHSAAGLAWNGVVQ